jgi:hypothetical protein
VQYFFFDEFETVGLGEGLNLSVNFFQLRVDGGVSAEDHR